MRDKEKKLKEEYDSQLTELKQSLEEGYKFNLKELQQVHESELDEKNKELQGKIEVLSHHYESKIIENIDIEINKYKLELEDKTKEFREEIRKLSDEKDKLELEKNQIINQLEKQIKSNLYNFTRLHNKNKDKIDELQEKLREEQLLKMILK